MIPKVNIHTHRPNPGALSPTSAGIHPWEAGHVTETDFRELRHEAAGADVVGEIGLDFHRARTPEERKGQNELFRRQLDLAEELRKPVVLHCVRAFEEVMRILSGRKLRAVIFHGFIGSPEQAQRAARQGYYLSFGEGSFRSPRTVEVLRSLPLERIFAETDESKVPIERIYEQIARVRELPVEELSATIYSNYRKIFYNE